MRRLNEILKRSGWNDATSPASGGPAAPVPKEGEACPWCGGAGFVRRAVPLGHPDFGKAFPCRCTLNEGEEERLARLQRYSNLGPLLRLTFDNLIPRGRSANRQDQERFQQAVAAAQRFSAQPEGWLVLIGPSGCGKTHLAAAIANRCIALGQPALFVVVPDLLDHLRAAYRPESEVAYDELFEQVRNAPVLILDDLGTQTSTPWAEEKLFQLLNHRYNARLPTVFTTNLDLNDFDARLQTRLSDVSLSTVHHLEEPRSSRLQQVDMGDLPLLQGMTFKNFDPRLLAQDEEELRLIQQAYRQALRFAQEPRDWLVIAGGTGRGKTRLAAAIRNYRRETGQPALFVIVPDLLDRLRASFNPQDPRAFDEMFELVKNAPVLILDDLGAQTGTPWAEEKLFQLLNYRYNACLPTVITTSLTVKEMERRVATRLTDPQVSTILPMGDFDFWGRGQEPPARPPRRGRPRRIP